MAIIHGEQYNLSIKIWTDATHTTQYTPSNCSDVAIKVGTILKKYSESEITYDSTNACWLFPITQAETAELPQVTLWQAAVSFSDGSIKKTPNQKVNVGLSIISEEL